MTNQKKIMGTFVPLTALSSLYVSQKDQGTFAVGEPFLKWLIKTHQSAWQLLPLHEPQLEKGSTFKHVPSPYKSYSIGLDPKYLPSDFACQQPTRGQLEGFITTHSEWITDFALFCSLRDHFKTDDWRQWESGIRKRTAEAIAFWTKKLQKEIDAYILLQWQLHTAYAALREKAHSLGVILVGDIPYYPSLQSPLVWAHQDVFTIENDGRLRYVSGIPNTSGAFFGRQVWGHPLYNWDEQEKVIAFWEMRIRYQAELFHHVRIDHAKAFFSYGVIDITNEKNDHYKNGPGRKVFEQLITFCKKNNVTVFAEDSGDRVELLRKVLKEFSVPGIKIFHFALKENAVIPTYAHVSDYPANCVAYTTTHDTETLLGYLQSLSEVQKKKLAEVVRIKYEVDERSLAKEIRSALLSSPAQMVIIPIQDWLLTTDRINIPGTEKEVGDTNWQYKVSIPIEKLPMTLVSKNEVNR